MSVHWPKVGHSLCPEPSEENELKLLPKFKCFSILFSLHLSAHPLFLFHFSSSCQYHVLDQWERPDGIKHRDHPFSLSFSFSPSSFPLCLSLSALSWTVLECQFSFLCRLAEFPLGLLWRSEAPCPLIILLAPHSSSFSMPLLFSLTVSPHNSHSVSLGLLQRDPLTWPCKNSSTAGC